MRRAILSWSSGKDSAWTLHVLRQTPEVDVIALVTTFNNVANRVAMHAVRRSPVQAQADRANLPLWSIELPSPCSNAAYEDLLTPIWQRAIAERVTEIAFGDLFLQDIRDYREQQLRHIVIFGIASVTDDVTRGRIMPGL
jgi:diphthamide synthase (EF-2-diphthine--ammonia ligase)